MLGASNNTDRARALQVGLWIAGIYVLFALWLLPDYGPTWDTAVGEFPYGDRLVEFFKGGDERYLDLLAREPAPPVREPHPDYDVRRTEWYVVHPFASIFSGLSCQLFWTQLGWMDAQSAHHLPTVLFTAVLLVALATFAGRRFGLLAGAASALLLITSPRLFMHSFVNLKDVPECVLYSLTMLAGYKALTEDGRRWWAVTGALAGLALATKANALFLPIQLGLFYVLSLFLSRRTKKDAPRLNAVGIALAALFFLAAYYAVSPNYWRSPIEGPGLRIGHMLRAGNALFSPAEEEGVALRGVSFEALLQVGVTTPILVLVFAVIGLVQRSLAARERLFLVLGLAVPIGRNLVPGMANYDGIRHFLEFLPFLTMAAGLGIAHTTGWLREQASWNPRVTGPVLLGLSVAPALAQVIETHPFGIAYYNALVGGLEGAQARGLRESTEYWGSSYKQGLRWLNANAEENARIHVGVAGHVARAMRKELRDDLAFWSPELDLAAPPGSVYVMYITRPSFYQALERELEAKARPVHEIRVQGGVILRIFEVPPGPEATALWALGHEEGLRRKSRNRLWNWLKKDPERLRQLEEITKNVRGQGLEAALEALRELFPPELHSDLRPAAEYLMPKAVEREP